MIASSTRQEARREINALLERQPGPFQTLFPKRDEDEIVQELLTVAALTAMVHSLIPWIRELNKGTTKMPRMQKSKKTKQK